MLNYINFINFKDVIEILLISSCIYYFLRWLKQDKQKNLVLYAYCFIGIFFMSYYYDLNIIYNLMLITTPFILIFFTIIHQNTLQKNFISLQRNKLDNIDLENWINDLIAGLLLTISKNKNIICVIEKQDSLNSFIKTPYKLHADINKEFFEVILDKQIDSNSSFIWINSAGKIIAINSLWNINIESEAVSELKSESKSLHNYLFISGKTDAIIIKSNYEKRLFDILYNGKTIENLTGNQLLTALKEYIKSEKNNRTFKNTTNAKDNSFEIR